MIERIKNDIFIRTKLIDLRIRSGEIIVTRFLSETLHLPFVLFSTINNKIVPCSPKKVKLSTNSVTFNTDSNVYANIKTNGRDALLINLESFDTKVNLESFDTKVGFMCPSGNSNCFFADQIEPIDKRFTTIAIYNNNSNDPTHQHLSIPVLHLVDKSCLSVFTQTKQAIQFAHFIHNCSPYFNVSCDNKLKASMRGFGNQRAAISYFYEQNGYVEPFPISGCLDLLNIKKALYLNAPLKKPSANDYLEQIAQQAQQLLTQHKVRNCIIGSLALSVYLSNIDVQDVDIAVDNLSEARKLFKQYKITSSEHGKWKDCAFRVLFKNIQVDIVEIKRFDWNAITEKKGIYVLKPEALLMMKLMGEFERSLMQPNYEVFKIKNQHSILGLAPKAFFVYPFFDDFLRLNSENNFWKLKKLLKDAIWDSALMSVTYPLHANVFSHKKTTLIPIINNGSPCNGKIWINKKLSSALWIPLDGHNENCKISVSCDATEIKLPIIENTGILVCKNA